MEEIGVSVKYCAELSGQTLTLENSLIKRQFEWNNGNLISRSIADKKNGRIWNLTGTASDCVFPGESSIADNGTFLAKEYPATSTTPAHLSVDVVFSIDRLEIRRSFRIYADCPAMACDYFLRGKTKACWRTPLADAADPGYINLLESKHWALPGPLIERVSTDCRHLQIQAIKFYDVTDSRNNLVFPRNIIPYKTPICLTGNLLLAFDKLNDASLFILKEAPCSDIQLAYPGCDFICTNREIALIGIGMDSDDLDEKNWTRCYGFVTGIASDSEFELLSAIRRYQENIRIRCPGRDHMIMCNTWGDHVAQPSITESFILKELDAAAKLGVTHFQLDHGWERARPVVPGWLDKIWDDKGFWDIHPEHFPNGLGPIVARAKKLGIELCLWYNPSKDDGYAYWRDDAERMIGLYHEYGIRTFKLDDGLICDKRAEINFRAMLDHVRQATNYEAVFNLDITAGRRFGYHYLNEYGNLFLENRYTDTACYYPHWTLRNLWMLSRYVPAQTLQIEFLNKWRNPDKYDPADSLAPRHIPFDYCVAVTMMAQPLAWLYPSFLPEADLAVGNVIRAYRKHQERIHQGHILPIGEEPCGTGWTGFQSLNGDCGYFVVYRELNRRNSVRFKTWNLENKNIRCKFITGYGKDFSANVDSEGILEFQLPEPFRFALYEYQ